MNFQNRFIVAIAAACFISGAYAQGDCLSLHKEAQQVSGQAKVQLYKQVLTVCKPSFTLYYQQGLAFREVENFSAALESFQNAQQASNKAESNYTEKTVAALGRQAEMQVILAQRAKAISTLKLAIKVAKDNKVATPDWLVSLQKQIDDAISEKPFDSKELRSLLNEARDVGIEPKIDYQITFDFNTATMTSDGEALLSQVVESFQDIHSNVVVVGHTDTKGDAAYNQVLSEKRAIAIKRVLAAKIPALANKLTTQGKGKTEPKYNGGTPDDDQRNRRVEFVFVQN